MAGSSWEKPSASDDGGHESVIKLAEIVASDTADADSDAVRPALLEGEMLLAPSDRYRAYLTVNQKRRRIFLLECDMLMYSLRSNSYYRHFERSSDKYPSMKY